MSDPWINRLVVSGLADDVSVFQNAVTAGEGPTATALSFTRLQAQLDEDARQGLDEPWEPWDDWNETNPDGVNPPQVEARRDSRFIDLEYNFSLVRFEPEPLLIRASELFPRLYFVLGWVAPNVDQAAGKFIHNGQMLEYWLSDTERETLRADAYRGLGLSPDYGETAPMDDDVALFADIQGDWAQLKAVVQHWDDTVARELEGAVADQ
jgi:hypothetical protein